MKNTVDEEKNELIKLLKQTQSEFNVLYDVSSAMRTTLELNHILHIILTGVTSHSGLGYNRAILFLVNPKLRALEFKMAIGPDSGEEAQRIWNYIENSNTDLEELIQSDKVKHSIAKSSSYQSLREIKFPLNPEENLLLSKAYFMSEPWHLTSQDIHKFKNDPLFKFLSTNDLLIMPLRAKNQVIGLIVADNIYTRKPITDDDVKIFAMLADQAALAIENSHLYELVVMKSHKDSLTNLWNHGFFQEKLTEELHLTQSHGQSLSLAMIDLDNFKTLNDTWGHQNGDKILTEIAKIIIDFSRESDLACRYGGEEFSIIFVNTNKNQCHEIAERLRAKIQNHQFQIIGPDQPLQLTVSIGTSTFPEQANTKEELINLADKAMYIAKFSGKNRTCVAEL